MLALTAAGTSSAWNAGGSILTFYFPIGLFIVISGLLWLQFGRPHPIPGSKPLALARTSSYSAGQGNAMPAEDGAAAVASHSGPSDPAEPLLAPDAGDTGTPEAEG